MAALQRNLGFDERLLRGNPATLTIEDFDAWRPFMSRHTYRQWTGDIEAALGGDTGATDDVWSLAFFGTTDGEGQAFQFTDAPGVVHRTVGPPTTATDTAAGQTRLLLTFKSSADLRLVRVDTGDEYVVRLERNLTVALVPDVDAADEDTDWLIDSWSGTHTVGKPRRAG